MYRSAVAAIFALSSLLAIGRTSPHSTVPPPLAFQVYPLSLPKHNAFGVAYGMNGRGLVVGDSRAGSKRKAEVWAIGANGKDLRRTDISPPKGFAGATFSGIDNAGVAAGTLSKAPDKSDSPEDYPATWNGRFWTALRAQKGSLSPGYATAIASNGVISGAVWNKRTQQLDAAIFVPSTEGKYRQARLLPVARSSTGSEALCGISVGKTSVEGGYEDLPSTNDDVEEQPVIWINDSGPYLIHTSSVSGKSPNFTVTGLSGTSLSSIYAVGDGYKVVSGNTGQASFVVHIDASRTKPIITNFQSPPLPNGVPFSYIASIGTGPGGDSGTITMGGEVADYAGTYAAVVWTASPAGSRLVFKSYTDLNEAATGPGSANATGCPTFQVSALNGARGVADAFCDAGLHPLTVTPSPK